MKVDPSGAIGATQGANLSHSGGQTLTVVAENQLGQKVNIPVPANTTIHWVPPEGWETVTFSAEGFDDEYHVIDPSFVATGVRAFASNLVSWKHLCVAATLASAMTTAGNAVIGL